MWPAAWFHSLQLAMKYSLLVYQVLQQQFIHKRAWLSICPIGEHFCQQLFVLGAQHLAGLLMFFDGVLNAKKRIKVSLYMLWNFSLSQVFGNLCKDSWVSCTYCNVMSVNLRLNGMRDSRVLDRRLLFWASGRSAFRRFSLTRNNTKYKAKCRNCVIALRRAKWRLEP